MFPAIGIKKQSSLLRNSTNYGTENERQDHAFIYPYETQQSKHANKQQIYNLQKRTFFLR